MSADLPARRRRDRRGPGRHGPPSCLAAAATRAARADPAPGPPLVAEGRQTAATRGC
jgi:hypothetical protein